MKAQSPREEFKQNIYKSGSNYYAYPGPEQQRLTPAPKGYTPYYISHYGRHGSRYLIGKSDYDRAWSVLLRADSLGKLTDYGKDVLRRVILLRNEADQRRGELTILGAEQHRDISRTDAHHFTSRRRIGQLQARKRSQMPKNRSVSCEAPRGRQL